MSVARRGHTILELMVAVTVGALVIGLTAGVGFKHQRFHRDVVIAVERSEQLDQLGALVPIALRSIVPALGDIPPGGAGDTALEFRATIMSAAICDSVSADLLLAPAGVVPRLAAVLTRPEPGDTAWLLATGIDGEHWTPRAIASIQDRPGACTLGGAHPFGVATRPLLALRLDAPPPSGSRVIRVTRRWRYSLYRASDGAWFLGAKEWNSAQARFNTIQPVAGPLLSAAAGGLRFRYLDSLGAVVPAGMSDTRGLAALEADFRIDSAIPGRYVHAASVRGRSSAVVAFRSRRR